jgi:sialate O-acetylesterase
MIGEKHNLDPLKEVTDGKLKYFAICGEDKKWVWADAVIDGATVVCSSPDVKAPVAVRYAFAMNPVGANLYNRDGMPASPFRSDNY